MHNANLPCPPKHLEQPPAGPGQQSARTLIVAALVHGHHAAHADTAAAVGHAPGEALHRGRLVLAGQAALVALSHWGRIGGTLG